MNNHAKILLASLLLAAGATPVLADAGWVGNSAVCILKNGETEDTWYYGDNELDWCKGEAFDGAYLGSFSESFYLSGQCEIWDNNNANWGSSSVMYMYYKIDDGEEQELTLNWYDFYDNNNHFKSGGNNFYREPIDISNLSVGSHTLAVKFGGMDDKYVPSADDYFVATFHIFEISNGAYIINTTDDLDHFAASLNRGEISSESPAELNADLKYRSKTFTPIGTDEHTYNAEFNGNSHTITGINIVGHDSNVGVFGYLYQGAWIHDLTVQGTVSGSENVGGLVGYDHCGSITGCTVKMAVSGHNYVGGLAGFSDGYISDCVIQRTRVSGEEQHVGGIVGYNQGTVEGCVSTASVEGSSNVGGIAGTMGPESYMQGCICVKDTVSGNSLVGAIIGFDEKGPNYNPDDEFDYHLSNNFYIETLNVLGVDGADVTAHSGAMRGYLFDDKPLDIGESSSEYERSGITYFDNGLYYQDNGPFFFGTYVMGYVSLYDLGSSNFGILQEWMNEPEPIRIKLSGRTLYRDGTWNTIFLPFNLGSFEGTPLEGATAMSLLDSSFDPSTGTLTLYFDEEIDGITAGWPFFVKWETTGNNITDPIFSNVTINEEYGMSPTPFVTECVDFYGTYEKLTFDEEREDILYLGANNLLCYPKPDADNPIVTIGAFRAYFKLHEGYTAGEPTDPSDSATPIKSFVLNFGDEETGIEAVHDSRFMVQNPAWHTLDGRRLSSSPSAPGLYISNGRKIMVK
ncbi:MAG: hypothetical protein J5543_10725 [Bacteroidales bacterium]|nr:hypothetical protein [Bacteroidales bacterium]